VAWANVRECHPTDLMLAGSSSRSCRRVDVLRLGFGALDFFVYSRDAFGTDALRDDDELLEEHWSYMDRFAASMIARGPTLALIAGR
jgi:hypothetical protein